MKKAAVRVAVPLHLTGVRHEFGVNMKWQSPDRVQWTVMNRVPTQGATT